MCLTAYIASNLPLTRFREKDRPEGVFVASGVRRWVPDELRNRPHCYYVGDGACSCVLMSDLADGKAARDRLVAMAETATCGGQEALVYLEWNGEADREECLEQRLRPTDLTEAQIWTQAMEGPIMMRLTSN